jgi:DNA repair exonuclease SbcCD nuclease subunit
MKNVLCISDFHLKGLEDSNYGKWEQNMFKATINRILELIMEHNPDTVLFLGDLFDSVPKNTDLFLFQYLLNKIPEGIRKIAISGNHTVVTGVNRKVYWKQLVKDDLYTHFGLEVMDWFEVNDEILFCGHGNIHKLENLSKDYRIIFSHLRSGISSVAKDEIDLALVLPHTELLVLGDIHQRLKHSSKAVYCGSPFYTPFSRTNDEDINRPSILKLDTETLKWSWLDLFEPEQWRKEVKDYVSVESFEEDFEELMQEANEYNKYFKVKIVDTSSNFANFKRDYYSKFCKIEIMKSDLTGAKQSQELHKSVQEKLQSNNTTENFTKFVQENNSKTGLWASIERVLATLEAKVRGELE